MSKDKDKQKPEVKVPFEVILRAWKMALLGFLFPGLGHWQLGKKKHAVVFALCVLAMVCYGALLDGRLFALNESNLLYRLGGIGQVPLGPLYFLGKAIGFAPGELSSVTFGYGSTFLVCAGLMNILLMMDCFDIVVGRKS